MADKIATSIIYSLRKFSDNEVYEIFKEVMRQVGTVFDEFRDKLPTNSNPVAQVLYEYERHYMRLIKEFQHEIEFIDGLHTFHAQEVKKFYSEDLPAIIDKLRTTPIANDVQEEWIKNLQEHMDKSFKMSQKFLEVLTTKKVEEFNAALCKKISEATSDERQ